jgi:hypothetical protein
MPKSIKIMIIAALLWGSRPAVHAEVNVRGDWQVEINVTAWEDGVQELTPEVVESDPSQIRLSINWFANLNPRYEVDITRMDGQWHPDLQLSLRRTGEGNGYPWSWLSGGTTYQVVTDQPSAFFSGQWLRNNIPVQLKLETLAWPIPAGYYDTTLYFTITGN